MAILSRAGSFTRYKVIGTAPDNVLDALTRFNFRPIDTTTD